MEKVKMFLQRYLCSKLEAKEMENTFIFTGENLKVVYYKASGNVVIMKRIEGNKDRSDWEFVGKLESDSIAA